MNSADVDQLRSLAALLKPLAELPAMLDRAMSADQAVREAEIKAARIAAENLDAMQAIARIRDEIASSRTRAEAEVAEADIVSRDTLSVARERAKLILTDATDSAAALIETAELSAASVRKEAATIVATIADKRHEVDRLDTKLSKIREQLKKMTEL